MQRLGYAKNKRLVSNRQFKAVLDHGRRAGNNLLMLYTAPNALGRPRLGISVGKSSGNAILRNRLKRLLREVFRQNQVRLPRSFDYVVMIAPSLSRRLRQPDNVATRRSLTFHSIEKAFLSLIDTVFNRPQSNGRTDRAEGTNT